MTTPSLAAEREPRVFNATDMAILEFERIRWSKPGRRVDEIFERFAMREARYAQVLNWIIDQPEAVAYDAELVNRLRRLRDRRAAVRTAGVEAAGIAARPDHRGVRPALLGGVL